MQDELIGPNSEIYTPSPIFKKSKAFFGMGIKEDVQKVEAFKVPESRPGASPRAVGEEVWSVKDRLRGKKSLMQSRVFATGGACHYENVA